MRLKHLAIAALAAVGCSALFGLPAAAGTATTPASVVPTGFAPASTSWLPAQDGYVLGYSPCGQNRHCGTLVTTTDGGTSWSKLSPPGLRLPANHNHVGITFLDAKNGFATDSTRLVATHDGGRHWSAVTLAGFHKPPLITKIAGAGGRVFVVASTYHYGTNTLAVYSGSTTAATLRPIFGQQIAVSGQQPYGDISTIGGIQVVVGADYTKERYATSTDGVHFTQAPMPCPTAWTASLGGVHGGRVQALCTSDPGMSKTGKLARVAPALGKPFVQVGKPSDLGITQGYAVASATNATIAATGRGINYLYGTFDGGKTWKATLTVTPDNPWFDLQFATAKVGAVVDGFPDLGSTLYRTTNRGKSWQVLTVH